MKYYYIFFDTLEVLEVCKLCDFDGIMERIADMLESGAKITRIECHDENDRL